MMNKTKAILAAALSMLLGAGCLAGCGSGGAAGDSPSGDTGIPTASVAEESVAAEAGAGETDAAEAGAGETDAGEVSAAETAAAETDAAEAGTGETAADGSAESAETQPTAAAETRPPVNLRGREIVMQQWGNNYGMSAVGNESDQIVQMRMKEMEEKYNCKFVFKQTASSYIFDEIRDGETAGEPFADVFCISASTAMAAYRDGYLLELSQLFGDEFYYPRTDLVNSGDGTYYTAMFNLSHVVFNQTGNTWIFNKDLFESRGIDVDALYQEVLDGGWTYERFMEVADQVAVIKDGVTEIYGGEAVAARRSEHFGGYLAGWGAEVMVKNEDGTYSSGLRTDQMRAAMENQVKMVNKPSIWRQSEGDEWNTNQMMFMDGRIGMVRAGVGSANGAGFAVGYLPMPKANKEDAYLAHTEEITVMAMSSSLEEDMTTAQAIADMLTYIYRPVKGRDPYEQNRLDLAANAGCNDLEAIEILDYYKTTDHFKQNNEHLAGLAEKAREIVYLELEEIQNGNISFDAGIDACDDAWQAVLDEYNAGL